MMMVSGRVRRFAFTIAGLALGCGGSDSHTTITTPAAVVGTVQVLPVDPSIDMGTSTALTVTILDTKGQPITGRTVTWTTSSTGIATVDATGLLKGISPGTAVVTATCESVVRAITVTVKPVPLNRVVVTTTAFAVVAGQQLALGTSLTDRNGAVATGRTVVWSTSSPLVATVDGNGLVTGMSAGTVTIVATAEGLTGSVVLTVTAPAGISPPVIASILPSELAPGRTVTITGANFQAGPSNVVLIDGAPATVTAATPTQITAVVSTTYLCRGVATASVTVTTPAGTAAATATLRIAAARQLAVGQTFLATDPVGRACNELPANGTYVVSVFNASNTSAEFSGVELFGSTSAATGASASAAADRTPVPMPVRVARSTRPVTLFDAARDMAARAHLDQLRFNIETFRRLGSPRKYARVPHLNASLLRGNGASSSGAPTALAAVPLIVGDSTTINYYRNSCAIQSSTKIQARVVYVGPEAIVLEDKASPLAGKVDDDLVAIAREWETISYPALVKNLGDPLAYDAHTDNNGRLIMMFTPLVNNTASNLLGFVQGCDFYPPTVASASNQAEIFYARVITDTSAAATGLNGRTVWRRQMPATVAHETKHIASFAERFAAGSSSFEDAWLEEGTAQIEAELYSRAIHGNTWRGNAGYTGGLDCELRTGDPACNGSVLGMYNNFAWLGNFEAEIEGASLISTNGNDGSSLYGGAWMFIRWMTDTYGGTDEGAFLSSIVKNFQNVGVANVVQRSGKSFAELLSQFSLMLATDELANVPSPYVEPSWNLPAVWSGYSAARTDFPAQPLAIREASFGAFSANTALKGGTAMLTRLSGTPLAGTQLIEVRTPGGGTLAPSSNIGIAVLRIK